MFGKTASKLFDVKLNLALLFTVSVLPDFDLLLFAFLKHRGPTHSLFFALVLCLPFFVVYKKKTIPYFVALLSHSMIGDIFSGGIQLYWPFSNKWVFLASQSGRDAISVSLELSLFVVCTAVMVFNKDFQNHLINKTKWTYWLIPLGSVLGPLVVNAGDYGYLPIWLVPPSLFYAAVFSYSVLGSKVKKDNE